MELFTLLVNPAVMPADELTGDLRQALESVHIRSGSLELRQVPLMEGTGVVCDLSPVSAQTAAEARRTAMRTLAGAVIRSYEDELLLRCVRREMGTEDREGVQSVMSHCRQLMQPYFDEEGTDSFLERRTSRLASEFEAYLQANTFLHIEGFLRFRADPYLEELRDTVSYAVDEWVMERQYQEFISLLKYFVYIQEAKIPAAHVIHHGNHDFTLLNELMMPIDTKQMDQFVVELIDKDINYEDVIVSTLIAVSPGKLYIHSRTPEMQVIKTMMTIFEGRAELCTNCPVCVPILEERRRK